MSSEWKEFLIEDLAKLSYGKMPKKQLLNSGEYPTFSGYKYQHSYPEKNVNAGDVIVVARGVGGTGDVKLVQEDSYLTNLSIKIDLNTEFVNKRYFYYSFLNRGLRHLDSGSAQSQITIGDLSKVELNLPPLPVQKAIAHILGTLDDKIELNRKMNETLEQMAQALFKSWFVDFDPVLDNAIAAGNEIPDALKEKAERRKEVLKSGKYKALPKEVQALFPAAFEYNEELEKWIPEGWEVKELDELSEIIVDCLHSKKPDEQTEGKRMIQVFNIGDSGRITWDKEYFVADEDFRVWNKRITPQKGDVFVTKTGRVGAIGQLLDDIDVTFGRNIVAIRPGDKFPMYSLGVALISDYAKREIQRNTSDGTILKSLHVKHLNKLKFVLSSVDVMQEMEKRLKPLIEKLAYNDSQITQLTKQRDVLLPQLISGKLRVGKEMKTT